MHLRRSLIAGSAVLALAITSSHALAAPTKIRFGWIPAVVFSCVVSAVESAKNENYEYELLTFKNSNEVLLALNTGQLDAGSIGYSVVATALARGDVAGKMVAGISSGTTSVVVRAGSGIKDWPDLRGKSVGSVRGSSEYTSLENAIASAGMKLGDDVKFVNFQSSTDIMVALRNGDIDAAASFEPAIAIAVKAGYIERAPAMTKTLFDTTYAISAGVMVSDEALENERAGIVNFLKAYVDNCKDFKANPDKAIDVFLKYQTGERDVMIDAYKAIAHGLVWDMPMDQIRVLPKFLPDIKPEAVPELTERFVKTIDYGPLSEATGETAEQLGDSK